MLDNQIKQYLRLLEEAKQLDARVVEKKAEARRLGTKIAEYLLDQNIKQVKIPEGATVTLKTTPRAHIPVDMKPSFFDWMRARGDEYLIKPDVHHKTLDTYCDSLRDEGIELPEYVKVHTQLGLNQRLNGWSPL